jgi:signal transduction histidine kinase/ActR/RegA family two-component response regulator
VLEQDPVEPIPTTQRASVTPFGVHAATPAATAPAGSSSLGSPATSSTLGWNEAPPGVDLEWIEAQASRLDLLLRTLVEPEALGRLLLSELAPLVGAAQGAVYSLSDGGTREPSPLILRASYAAGAGLPESLRRGEGLIGQCALDQRKRVVRDVPDEHFRVRSGLGSSAPRELAVVPVWLNETTLAVIELGFASALTPSCEALLDRLAERRPRPEPARSAAPGARGANPGRRPLPSHRSGFWGKLSHELRSPLNSVLVLSQLLSENEEHNLTSKQVSFAKAIHASGSDLLALINAISDLSKIETNRLVLEPTEMPFEHFKAHLERAFAPVARERGLEFVVELEPGLPPSFVTDAKRLRQIMKCLLSNAFKFTESGRVSVNVAVSRGGWSADRERLNNAREVIAFSVSDTGVGMSESEQRSILEVFPPDRIESRRGLGASGLGLAISRELGRLLGGDLRVASRVGSGSTFKLYLPTCGLPSVAAEEPPPESQPARVPSPVNVSVPSSSPASSPGSRRSGSGRPRGKRRDAEASIAMDLSGWHIMLVDDDVRTAFALTGLLERQGASVSHAEDVSEALERLGEGGGPSALLIDAELLISGSDGSLRHVIELCQRLPVVALAGPRLAAGDVDRRVPAEVHRLAKPIDSAQLLSLLRAITVQGKPVES